MRRAPSVFFVSSIDSVGQCYQAASLYCSKTTKGSMSKLTYLLYACPGCQSAVAAASPMFEVQMLDAQCWVRQCSSCDLIFKDRFPTEVGLKQLYPESYPHFESSGPDVATENAWRQKLMRAKSHHQQNGNHTSLRLLDVGCGAGGFVNFAQREGYLATGVDPHLPESRRSERMLRGQPEDLAPQQFDIVSMLNVAEHLTDPLASFAANVGKGCERIGQVFSDIQHRHHVELLGCQILGLSPKHSFRDRKSVV